MSNSQEYRNREAARRARTVDRATARKGKTATVASFTPKASK